MADAEEFRDFEHRGWERAAAHYGKGFGELTQQSVEPLLDAVQADRGARLLDVACGPGYVAAAAAARGSSVLGIDFSAEMVEEARGRYPGLEFQEGDAEQLLFSHESFDAVTLNFGMLHL